MKDYQNVKRLKIEVPLKYIGFQIAKALYSANLKLVEPMPILAGTRLGPYEIFSNVSAGGMGKVSSRRHRARGRSGAKDPSGMACEPRRVDAPRIEKD